MKRILHVVKQQVTPVRDSAAFTLRFTGRYDLVETVPKGKPHAVRVQGAIGYREIHRTLR